MSLIKFNKRFPLFNLMFPDFTDTGELFNKDFEGTITDDILTISAENKKIINNTEDDYSRKEIKAKYDSGVLKVHLRKLEILKSEEHKKVFETA